MNKFGMIGEVVTTETPTLFLSPGTWQVKAYEEFPRWLPKILIRLIAPKLKIVAIRIG